MFKLRDIGNGNVKEYTLVFPEGADHENKISILDELGSELFAREAGDIVRFNKNGKATFRQIVEVMNRTHNAGKING